MLQIRQNSTRCFFLLYMPRSVGSWRISGEKWLRKVGPTCAKGRGISCSPTPRLCSVVCEGGHRQAAAGPQAGPTPRRTAVTIADAGIPTALEQRSPRSRWRCQHAQPIPRAKFWRFTDKKCRCAAAAAQWSIWWDIVQEIRKYCIADFLAKLWPLQNLFSYLWSQFLQAHKGEFKCLFLFIWGMSSSFDHQHAR